MYIAIANFPMGKAIMDYLDATGIELDEDTIFHLDNILMERELKQKIIEINELDREAIKNLDYYSSAILTEDLDTIRHWNAVSGDLSVRCYLNMTKENWLAVVAGEGDAALAMADAIKGAQTL